MITRKNHTLFSRPQLFQTHLHVKVLLKKSLGNYVVTISYCGHTGWWMNRNKLNSSVHLCKQCLNQQYLCITLQTELAFHMIIYLYIEIWTWQNCRMHHTNYKCKWMCVWLSKDEVKLSWSKSQWLVKCNNEVMLSWSKSSVACKM